MNVLEVNALRQLSTIMYLWHSISSENRIIFIFIVFWKIIFHNKMFRVICSTYLTNILDFGTMTQLKVTLPIILPEPYVLMHGFRNIGQFFRNAGPCSQNEVK